MNQQNKLCLKTYESLKDYLLYEVAPITSKDANDALLKTIDILNGLSKFEALDRFILAHIELLNNTYYSANHE